MKTIKQVLIEWDTSVGKSGKNNDNQQPFCDESIMKIAEFEEYISCIVSYYIVTTVDLHVNNSQ